MMCKDNCTVCDIELDERFLTENAKGEHICFYCYESYEYMAITQPPSAKSINRQFATLEKRLVSYFSVEKTFFNEINDHQQQKINDLTEQLGMANEVINRLLDDELSFSEAYELGKLYKRKIEELKEGE